MFGTKKALNAIHEMAGVLENRISYIDHEIKALKFQVISFSVQLNELKILMSEQKAHQMIYTPPESPFKQGSLEEAERLKPVPFPIMKSPVKTAKAPKKK